MTTLRATTIIAVTLLLTGGFLAQEAMADHGLHGPGHYFDFYGGYGPNVYTSGQLPVPPYFAVHPPVHYGLKMVRHYGHSPFTCPCTPPAIRYSYPVAPIYIDPRDADSPQVEAMRVRLVNHYAVDDGLASSAPQRMVNPFVKP